MTIYIEEYIAQTSNLESCVLDIMDSKIILPEANDNSLQIDRARAKLRVAVNDNPDDEYSLQTLRKSLTASYIKQAAQQGIFICYTPTDFHIAQKLLNSLKNANLSVFINDSTIVPNEEWDYNMRRALRRCGVLLTLFSPDALFDMDIHIERTYFLRTGKIVIPVIIKDCNPQSLNTLLPKINLANDYRSGLHKLLTVFDRQDKVGSA